MISYPELNEFAKLCFADSLDNGTHIYTCWHKVVR